MRCLAPFGQLLEIGKYDILKGTPLSMRPMHDNIGFQGIDLDSLLKGDLQDKVHSPVFKLAAHCGKPGRHFMHQDVSYLLSLFLRRLLIMEGFSLPAR